MNDSNSEAVSGKRSAVSGLKVVIPAAGGGTRLKPHTHTLPKVLLHVADKPILGHILDLVKQVEPEEVIVVVGNQGEQIERYLRESYSLNLRFVTQDEPRGLGHAVAQAAPFVTSGPVLVLLGDTILDIDLRAVVAGENQLGVRIVEDPRRFGVVELKDGYASRVIEKPAQPKSNLAIVGVYYFQDSQPLFKALDDLIRQDRKTRGEYQLTDALQMTIERGVKIKPFTVEHWLDCGTTEALLDTNSYLLQTRHSARERGNVVLVPPVYVEDSAIIENSVIGPNVSVCARAEIRSSVIRDAIINQDAQVTNAVMEHSILGDSAKFQGRATHLNLGGASEMSE
jgi:glucose-1-phosphate thymidylyltransferase